MDNYEVLKTFGRSIIKIRMSTDMISEINYLMHTVYPFSGTNEERRSVSFNANLEFYNYNYDFKKYIY
tara:strand:+ start:181 stop:384 length:204 start_codon:yes stop_codon:yes gene_type:complete